MRRLNKKELINELRKKYDFISIDDKVIIFRNYYDMLWGTMVIEHQPETGKTIIYGVPKKQKRNHKAGVSKFVEISKG